MSKYNFYQELKKEESELVETLSALRLLIKRYESENQHSLKLGTSSHVSVANDDGLVAQDNPININMSIPKKLMYVLELLGRATSKEVAEKAYELDSSRSLQKWVNDARFYLSKYYNEGKLTVVEDNTKRGNVYLLK